MQPGRHALFTETGGAALPEFRIGLSPVPVEQWFEGGEPDPAARKAPLYRDHPDLVWRETEGSHPAQAEVAAMVGAWVGQSVDIFRAAALLVSDDLCLMEKLRDGWTLTAASLCAPSFFSAAAAVGKPLCGLHGPVPGFNENLLPRVARIFDHLPDDQILERRNWTVVNDPEPFQPDPAPFRARLAHQSLDQIADSLVVRRERQTIRRAPVTRAILFTIRIWTEPLDDLLADPLRRAAFAEAWETLMSEAGADFRRYKRLDLFDAAVRARLARN
jgi:hypothetical protein